MDGIATTCVILLALLTLTQIVGLFLWFRSAARREEEARGLREAVENNLARTLEIEATAKSFGPAIERSAGATVERLADTISALEAVSRELTALQEGINNGNSQRAKHTLVLGETQSLIAELRALATKSEATSREIARSLGAVSGRADEIGAELARRLGQLESQLQSLRSELGEATRF